MIAFPSMLVRNAEAAGIAVPENPDDIESYKETHPRFWLFAVCQCGEAMPYPSCAWDNAHVIAAIPEEDLRTITYAQLLARGFRVGDSRAFS